MTTTTTTAGTAPVEITSVGIVNMSRSSSPELDPVAVSEDLTPLPSLKQAGNSAIDFDGQLDAPLKVREDVRSGCGGQTWPAGLVLGKHMLRYHREELRDARILELGAGGGLVGLAVALACGGREGRSRLLLTDQDEMLELMQHNIRLNEVDSRADALVLNWGEPLPDAVVQQKPNVILAAECVYFEPAFPLLMQTLKDLFALNEDAVVYFCFKKRRRADLQFVKMAKKAFLVEELFDEDRPVFSRQSLFLFSFRSKRGPRTNGSAGKEAKADGQCSSNTTARS
ncbi:Nicotinamide N-methyltransferase [Purpureocillium lavendulum]|uniref:Protein-lysine N-methyltransferase EFM6 n=1 Tax=Purpureocillium lavendulum TaxID=1247861 RepID=A0AB34FPI8_9HYPO|nr:Nicotinamide N-methyltransferase [Purpureocillium lavendulum]